MRTIHRIKSLFKPSEWGFLGLVALYILICLGLTSAYGLSEYFYPIMYLQTGAVMTGTFALTYILYRLVRAVYIMVVKHPKNLTKTLIEDLRAGPLRLSPYKRAIPILIGFLFFFSAFTSMKILISQIMPFAWDEAFMKLDQFMHAGVDPWRVLHPILSQDWATYTFSFVYILWLPVFFGVLYWQLFREKDDALRIRFFYTFVLSWAINGTFLAIIFSSAGPCFYEAVTDSDHFAPLMEYLRDVNTRLPIYAVTTQDLLWNNYKDASNMAGGGISAFPSVHVATAFLFVLVGRQVNRAAFIGFAVFFAMILLGSIHLGWHYAVDGYASILTTLAIWWGLRRSKLHT